MATFSLKRIIVIALIAISLETSNVYGGSFGACGGQRLDTLASKQYMSASQCVSMGGTCCATDSVRDHTNEDPRIMSATGRCFSCYNSNVVVKCTGSLIRSKPAREADWWVTAAKCNQVGGSCCQKSATYAFSPQFMTTDPDCINCYSGQVALPCGGSLLASNDYTAKTCTTFGGSCCDEYPTGGDAFNARTFPNPESLSCLYCYSGLPAIYG
uniref:Uncharacterized protein n=1 Tax=Daphnia magna TaxID=35525 RepID=A0A0P6G176_9CRUS